MSRSIEGKIKINSFADIVGAKKDAVAEIPLADLHEFRNHPFRVLDDEKMEETVASIKEHGVLVPGIVRPLIDGGYEIISGHRRKRACEILGLETMPAIIKHYTDDQAVIAMVDSNLYRDDILPSEKARAYKMKYDAEKHQGQDSENIGKTLDIMAEGSSDSAKTIQRYIWLSRLSENLLNMVDNKKIPLFCGIDVSFLKEREQKWVEDVITDGDSKVKISLDKSAKLKKYSLEGSLNKAFVIEILSEEKPKIEKISFKRERISSYFDDGTSEKEMEDTIVMLLENWKKGRA